MHIAGLVLFALIALFWVFHGMRVALGAIRLPHLRDFPALTDAECPSVSLLFAARDEEEKLPAALTTLQRIDYPQLQIIAVNDRSADATGRILQEAATQDPRLKVITVEALPPGWLGKPHALKQAYGASSGEWLLFTDADVKFRPDAIRRAMAIVNAHKLDHLTLIGDIEMHGFWEKTVLTFFALGFYLGTNPRAVSNPKSRAYLGIGAFQLVRRSAYEASGTHRRLAMEVVDDIKLGKIVKQSGFRSAAGLSGDYVSVRWHSGLGNIIRGVTKNFFATAGFRIRTVVFQLAGVFCTNVLPFVALPFVRGWMLALAAASALMAIGVHAGTAIVMGASPLYALTHPLGALIFDYMLLRSTAITLKQGGIVWRGTFYPLKELRRGLV
jgi:cellulose synthase/poly-beta-1,6-N-acetylglucosamine synthase-like glycosyltransferase